MPKVAMKPMAAEIENGRSRRYRATMPPVAATGTLRKIKPARRMSPNITTSSTRIAAMAAGTTTESRLVASCRFWNCPLHCSEYRGGRGTWA